MTRDEIWLLKEKYGGEKTEGFFADCKQLAEGVPLAYVIGHVPFLGVTIHLDTHPLIPRTETEYWTEKVIAEMRSSTHPIRVLDLCAGSGCIGVAVLMAVPGSHVDFVEIDKYHHVTVHKNIKVNGIDASRTRVLGGDLFECVTGAYDYILANPPYIDRALGRTDEAVIAHEPAQALFAEEAGFLAIRRIIEGAVPFLEETGVLYIEHEPEHAQSIHELGRSCGLGAEVFRDQFGTLRYSRLTRIPN